jgi:hypothetical protein
MLICLEPISKSSEEENKAGELDESKEVLGVVFPADENAALPLDPRKEAFDEPAAHVAGYRLRSWVGGLLLVARCGAIISMPSRRNSSSSGSLS